MVAYERWSQREVQLYVLCKKGYLRFSSAEFPDSNGKMLSIHRQDFPSKFLSCANHIYLIFLQGKVLVFQHVPAHRESTKVVKKEIN